MVRSASSNATSGRISGDTMPFFSDVPVVRIATIVTSDPVPAVVGTSTNGNRRPRARPTPYMSSSG